jgi:hypothetical protein
MVYKLSLHALHKSAWCAMQCNEFLAGTLNNKPAPLEWSRTVAAPIRLEQACDLGKRFPILCSPFCLQQGFWICFALDLRETGGRRTHLQN